MKMSLLVDHKKAQSLPFQTKFGVRIGQVVPELCINNFFYVNLQWSTNAEYKFDIICIVFVAPPTVRFAMCFRTWISCF